MFSCTLIGQPAEAYYLDYEPRIRDLLQALTSSTASGREHTNSEMSVRDFPAFGRVENGTAEAELPGMLQRFEAP